MGQPLNIRNAIVNDDGTPNQYFIRWMQEQGFDIDGKASPEDIEAAIQLWSSQRDVNAGTGLSGGGNLSSDVTLNLNAGINLLTDVDTATTPPTNGQALVWDNTGGIWKPGSVSGGGGGFAWRTTATGTGVSQAITIPYLGLASTDLFVFVNGLKWLTSEYSVSGNTVTITTNAAGDTVEVYGPVGVEPESTQWRMYVTSYQGGSLVSIGELYLYNDLIGTDIATTGTPTQSSQYDVFGPSRFLDRNLSTFSCLQLSGPLPGWYQVTFPTAKKIKGFGVYPRASELDNSPKDFKLQFLDGGVWKTMIDVTNQTGWTASKRDYY